MDTDEITTTLIMSLALAAAAASAWLSRVLMKKLEASGQSVARPWRWWMHALAFIAFVNVLMLFHFFAAGALFLATLCGLLALAFGHAGWPSELRRSAYLAVGALSAAWLALGAYELTLGSWKETVVGAPIRVDLIYLFAPLLYYSSVKIYRAYSSAFALLAPR